MIDLLKEWEKMNKDLKVLVELMKKIQVNQELALKKLNEKFL